jgi:acyl carrier protein
MTAGETRTLIARLLADIAPDADVAALAPADDLQEALDLDSMDRMALVVAVSEQIGRDIPDREAGRLRALDDWCAYLAED